MFPVVSFLKCVVTEVFLFLIVAFKTLDISQGSVVTHLRCGGIFSVIIIIYYTFSFDSGSEIILKMVNIS